MFNLVSNKVAYMQCHTDDGENELLLHGWFVPQVLLVVVQSTVEIGQRTICKIVKEMNEMKQKR